MPGNLTAWGGGMRKKRDLAQLETRRLQGTRLLRRGVSQAEVARRVGVSRTSVFRWARALETNGRRALRKAPRTGRPPLLNDAEKKRLIVALEAGALAQGCHRSVDVGTGRPADRDDQR